MLNNDFFEQSEIDALINKAIKEISDCQLDKKNLIGNLIAFLGSIRENIALKKILKIQLKN